MPGYITQDRVSRPRSYPPEAGPVLRSCGAPVNRSRPEGIMGDREPETLRVMDPRRKEQGGDGLLPVQSEAADRPQGARSHRDRPDTSILRDGAGRRPE